MARVGHDLEAYELMVVEAARAGGSPGILADLQVPAAVPLRDRAVVDPRKLDNQVAARRTAPLHAELDPIEQQQ